MPGGSPRRSSGRRRDVHERALGLLAVRQRSRVELERRLLGAGFGAEEVAVELRRLEDVGLIDDRAFASALAEHAVRTRNEGRRAVARRLVAAGVPGGVVDDALREQMPDDDEERALELARSRAGRMHGLSPDRAYARLAGLLARRGYAPEVARSAARKALALESFEA